MHEHGFTIISVNMTAMEKARTSLPSYLQDALIGSGYDLSTGERDHQFKCGSIADMNEVIGTYRKIASQDKSTIAVFHG
jgi:hypothetical protein